MQNVIDFFNIFIGLGGASLIMPAWKLLLAHTKNERIKSVEVWATQYVVEQARLLGEDQGGQKKANAVKLLTDRITENGYAKKFTNEQISNFIEAAYDAFKKLGEK